MLAQLGGLSPHPGGSKGVRRSGIISIVRCSGGYSLSLRAPPVGILPQNLSLVFTPTPIRLGLSLR